MSDSDLRLLDQLAEEYIERLRRGDHPTVEEYAARLPEHGEEIRELFPCLGFVDQVGSTQERPAQSIGNPLSGLTSPQQLGEYRILREVARGGMGVVYEAEHRTLQRRVALKVLPPSLARKPQYLLRFRREARSAGRLHHSHIVPLFDIGHEQGIHFYTMQFIDGQSLDHVISDIQRAGRRLDSEARRPREHRPGSSASDSHRIAAQLLSGDLRHVPHNQDSVASTTVRSVGQGMDELGGLTRKRIVSGPAGFHASIARVGAQIADALAYAHTQGILHRDIKPANILLDTNGSAWVTDFGLAKDDDLQLTSTGNVLGTMRYLAPEQLRGIADPRGDVYSLGVTLYELVTSPTVKSGSGPLTSYRPDSMKSLPRPREIDPSVPKDLETIVWKAMAHEPARRYQTASELGEDLRRFLTDRPIRARPFSPFERAWMWARRRPVAAAGLVLLGAMLSVIVTGGWILSARAMRAERMSREQLMDSKVQNARALTLSRRSGQRFQSLALIDEARDIADSLNLPSERYRDLREVAISALSLPDVHPSRIWDGTPDGTAVIDFDRRLQTYVRKSIDGSFSVRRVMGDVEFSRLEPAPTGPHNGVPYLSRDGRYLVVWHYFQDATHIWRIDDQRLEPILSVEDASDIAFDASGEQVAIGHVDGSISRYELSSGRLLGSLKPLAITREIVIAVHPQDPLVAVTSYFANLVAVRDLRSGAAFKLITLPGRGGSVAWSPSGDWLAATDESGNQILVYDRATLSRCFSMGPIFSGARLAFSHSGDLLATTGWSWKNLQIFDFRAGRLLFEENDLTMASQHPRFSQDDSELAGFIDGNRIGLLQIADGRECRILKRRQAANRGEQVRYYGSTNDGRLLAVAMDDGVGFWDLESGHELDFLEVDAPRTLAFERTAHGRGSEPATAILIGDVSGLYRWPIRYVQDSPTHVVVGPAKSLAMPQGEFSQSGNGQVQVVACRAAGDTEAYAGVWIRNAQEPSRLRHLQAGVDLVSCAVHPDGTSFATAEHLMDHSKLWHTATGELEREIPGAWSVQFSEDGRWFKTSTQLVDARAWQTVRSLKWYTTIAPRGDYLVTSPKTGTLAWTEAATDREIVRFTAPDGSLNNYVAMTSDERFIISTDLTAGIRVWDLPLIQRRLGERGLAWSEDHRESSGPSFALPSGNRDASERSVSDTASPSMTLEIDRRGFDEMRAREHEENLNRAIDFAPGIPIRWLIRGEFHDDHAQWELAERDYRQAMRLAEEGGNTRLLAKIQDALARLLATTPELKAQRDELVSLAESAIKLRPGEAEYETTLGIAYFRAGRWSDAVAALDRGLEQGSSEATVLNLYYLAMCHHHLHQPNEAMECLVRARSRQRHQDGDSLAPHLQAQMMRARRAAHSLLETE